MKLTTIFPLILMAVLLTSCGGEPESSDDVAAAAQENNNEAVNPSSETQDSDSSAASDMDDEMKQAEMNEMADSMPHFSNLPLSEVLHNDKPSRQLSAVMGPTNFHGIHGMTFNKAGELLVGSVVGQAIHKVDVNTGDVTLYKAPPHGLADDLEEGPDGSLAWTSYLTGHVYVQKPGGPRITVASNLIGINSIAFDPKGRLFATQVFLGDALYELDPTGKKEPRKILENLGGLNGFDFGDDGKLYGPIWFKGEVVKVDVDTAEIEVIASGFGIPAAVNIDSQGNLYVIDTQTGEIVFVDRESGQKELIAITEPALDNLAIDSEDNIFVSNMADNSIKKISPDTGEVSTIVSDGIATVSDIAVYRRSRNRDVIFTANVFSANMLSLKNGEQEEVDRVFGSEIEYPTHVAVGKKVVLFSSSSVGTVHIYTLRGSYVNTIHGLAGISDVLPIDRETFAYINAANASVVITSYDNPNEPLLSIGGFKSPTALVWESEETLLVSDRLAGSISRVNTYSGKKTPFLWGLKGPEGMDIALNGDLIVAEVAAQRLTNIRDYANSSNPLKKVIVKNLPIGLTPPAGYPDQSFLLTGVAVSSQGDVYFSSDIDGAVYLVEGYKLEN